MLLYDCWMVIGNFILVNYENEYLREIRLDIESDDSVESNLEKLYTYIIATTNLVSSNQTLNDLFIFNH